MATALKDSRADLVVAPETAVPLLPEQLAELVPGYWEAIRQRFEGSIVEGRGHGVGHGIADDAAKLCCGADFTD